MKLQIPIGGFFCRQGGEDKQPDIESRLLASGAQISTPAQGVVLAAWPELDGQGIWSGPDGAVAYDLSLSNTNELAGLLDKSRDENADPGRLLMDLYLRFGQEFMDRLRGEFSFCLWDGRGQRLLVATDFYGIRPVVYFRNGGESVAASRIGQVMLAGSDRDINPEAVYHYLFFQAICTPLTIYKQISKLGPGRALSIEPDRFREFEYYDLQYPTLDKGEDYWRRVIPQALEKAVSRYVPRDEPRSTGCFLSGGTDSSTIAGYYTRLSGQPARTFSIGFDDPKYNELNFARTAAGHFKTEPHEYLINPDDVLSLLQYLPRIYHEPFGNASVIAVYFCARMAGEQGVRTMLGGDGGDEIFGGNERYVTNLVFERYFRLPALVRKALLEPALKVLPGKEAVHKARRYVRRANMPNPQRFYSYNLLAETDNRTVFQPEFLEELDTNCFLRLARENYDRPDPALDTDRLLYLDMKFTITDNDLRKVTQMVEAAGLRARFPLLDRDLVDFAGTIPPWLKVRPGRNRYMFKQAMRGFLPDEIIEKSKHGMGLPVASWLKHEPRLSELINDTVFSSEAGIRQYIRPDYLDRIRADFKGDQTSFYGDNLWVFLVLENWLRYCKK